MSTPKECQEYVIGHMLDSQGDDLIRARRKFGMMSAEQRDKEWGESGKTPNQILKEYEDHNRKFAVAIHWLRNLET